MQFVVTHRRTRARAHQCAEIPATARGVFFVPSVPRVVGFRRRRVDASFELKFGIALKN